MSNRVANKKQFELKDLPIPIGMGNVRHRIELAEMAVISDCKNPEKDGAYRLEKTAEIQNIYNYYSFGMPMHRRNYTSSLGAYRFGFNGKEKDDELKGEGNSLDFGARIYDSRLGRWLSLDPLQVKYPSMSPYLFCYSSPINVVEIDGKEGIVISGQPGDHNYREHFLVNGLDRAKNLVNKFKKEGKKERVTWIVYNGGGEGGYDSKTIEKYKKIAKKSGITFVEVSDADKIVDYVNDKNGGDTRSKDKISNLFYFGHATPGDLDVGFVNHGIWNMITNDKIEPSDFKASAFKKGCMIDVVGGCRTAVEGNLPFEKSVVDQLAGKVDNTSTVKGSSGRVDYSDKAVDTDEQLTSRTNSKVVIKKGTN